MKYTKQEVISILNFVNDRLPDLYSRFNAEGELEEWEKATATTEFEEISTDFTDENGVLHLDGYKINQDEGEVVGYFINGEVYYTKPEYRYDSLVQETVEQLKQQK